MLFWCYADANRTSHQPNLLLQTFKVRCFAKNIQSRDHHLGLARFLGAWHGVFPLQLSEINLNLTARHNETIDQKVYSNAPQFNQTDQEFKELKLLAKVKEEQAFKKIHDESKDNGFTLESGSGCKLLGGTHSTETDLRGTLKRLLQEIAPDCIESRHGLKSADPWMEKGTADHVGSPFPTRRFLFQRDPWKSWTRGPGSQWHIV